jgi:hypothetical protein
MSDFGDERVEWRLVGVAASANDDVHWRHGRKKLESDDFAQPALQGVPIDRGLAMTGNDDADSRGLKRGSADSDVETTRPNSLPLS